MILADEPAYDLPPVSRALKFDDFDRLCAEVATFEEERAAWMRNMCAASYAEMDYWDPGPTLLGGYEGEVAMAVPGAVPELELEG